MKYRITLFSFALSDLDQAYQFAADQAPDVATRWLVRFQATLQSPDESPERCPLARENKNVEMELRELLFGKRPNVFRVLFTIHEGEVRVLRILRAQRRFLTQEQIDEASVS